MAVSNPKYVVVLSTAKTSQGEIGTIQQQLGVRLTSSAELGNGVRAQDIYASGSGIVFKNLGVAVVENVEMERMTAVPGVLYVEPERIYRPVNDAFATLAEIRKALGLITEKVDLLESQLRATEEEPPSPGSLLTWGLRAIGANGSAARGAGVKVCVLDTGLDAGHPDFASREIKGKSFVEDENWDLDGSGHGTHVAGILCGGTSGENNLRYGVAPDVDLLVAKVLADSGGGSTGDILNGIDWALENGARLMNLSLGSPVAIGEAPSPVFETVGERALKQSCLLIAAAGNGSRRPQEPPRPVGNPANSRSIMAVAALARDLRVASFSNGGINADTGGRIDISAPGVEVYSSYSRNAADGEAYRILAGTSMAAPYVAGVAALYLERFTDLSASELWLRLEKEATLLAGQDAVDVGAGMVRVLPEQKVVA